MNRDIFDKNMEYLKKEYPDVVEKINHINIDDNWERGGIEKAENGSLVLFQMVNGRKWYKNSRLNPDLASEIYASRYCVQSYEVYFIFGFSDGKCIRNIMNKCEREERIKFVQCLKCSQTSLKKGKSRMCLVRYT